MTTHELRNTLLKGESISLECKKAKGGVPNSIWATYSAFANTYGGTILLGVEENTKESDPEKRFSIIGIDDAAKLRADLWNVLNNTEKVSINLLTDKDVAEETLDGKIVLAIRVPRATVSARPVYINGNPLRGTYKRNHEGDYHMSKEEIRMMLRDADDNSNDKMLLEHYTMDDIDMPSLISYRNRFSSRNPAHTWNTYDHKHFLMEFGAYDIDRNTGHEWLTMAGLLMFGKGISIRNKFSNLRMDYIDKSHLDNEERYNDRLTYDGTWENNLYNFLEIILPKLLREVPRPFKTEGVVRIDDSPQHKAVREAFTNAIIHADFMLEGLLRVVKYSNRFEFTNPGLLKIPVERIYAGYESKARNQSIQNMLRMIGLGEGIGSGFPLILSATAEKKWKQPDLYEELDLMQVKLILHIEPEQENVQKNDQKNVQKEITDRQRLIMAILSQNPYTTLDEMSKRIDASVKTIHRDIKVLQDKGIITREGGRAEGKWKICTE